MITNTKQISARKRRRLIAQTRRRQAQLGRGLRNAMRKFFQAQAKRAIDIWLDADGYLAHTTNQSEYKDAASQMLGAIEDDLIVAASRPYVLEMTIAAVDDANHAMAAAIAPMTGTNPTVLYLGSLSAQRVVLVNATTRKHIGATVTRGIASGFSPREIAYGSTATREAKFRTLNTVVENLYRGRPECIARTEMAYANNGAAIHTWEEQGLTQLEIRDGPGCALTHHAGKRPGETTPDDVNGRIVTTKEANQWQIAHPNCQRVFLPTHSKPTRRQQAQPLEAYVPQG